MHRPILNETPQQIHCPLKMQNGLNLEDKAPINIMQNLTAPPLPTFKHQKLINKTVNFKAPQNLLHLNIHCFKIQYTPF